MRGLRISMFLVPLLVLAGCVSQSKYLDLERNFVDRGEYLANLNKKTEALSSDLDKTTLELNATRVLLQKREEELALVRQTSLQIDQAWKRQLTSELEDLRKEGFEINKDTGGIILEESVFFTKGSAMLKQEAKSALMKLANVLAKKQGLIQINGHTDSDKVVKTAADWPYGNIQLSGARAMQVLIFLRDEGKISGARMSFAGYGEHQPLASNATEDGKKKNRRVEVILKGGNES